jgi:hypothetical protein
LAGENSAVFQIPPDQLSSRGVDVAPVQDTPPSRASGPVLAPTQTESYALKILILEDDPNDAELITRE